VCETNAAPAKLAFDLLASLPRVQKLVLAKARETRESSAALQQEAEAISMPKLDDVDLRILRELRFDARIKNNELAQRVGLSPTPCWNRVRALERDGVIQRYVTILDARMLGLPDIVFVEVMLAQHDEAVLDAFGAAVEALPEVIEAWLVSGDYDYMIKVAVAGAEGYQRFLREHLFRMPEIRHTRSSFALSCLKQTYSPSPRPSG
jgi:Lrp/AsnC family leucine-responsive transcriptional regulator